MKTKKTCTFILDGLWGLHSRWEGLRRRVESTVGPCEIWRYDTTGRKGLAFLGSRLARDLAKHGESFHLVGYSMGGLIAREAMRCTPGLPLQRAVFLHSPHRGSMAAYLLPLPAARDMCPGSAFLRRLEAAPWRAPTLATWCPWDLMVLPGKSAAWLSATALVRLDVPAHAWPVFSGRLHRTISEFLASQCLSPGRDWALQGD